eukprot:COSAG02_NODE_4097_length_5787_cov_1.650492_9_plen_181_part_00
MSLIPFIFEEFTEKCSVPLFNAFRALHFRRLVGKFSIFLKSIAQEQHSAAAGRHNGAAGRGDATELAGQLLQHAWWDEQFVRILVPLLQYERLLCVSHGHARVPRHVHADSVAAVCTQTRCVYSDSAECACLPPQTTTPTTTDRHTTTTGMASRPTLPRAVTRPPRAQAGVPRSADAADR